MKALGGNDTVTGSGGNDIVDLAGGNDLVTQAGDTPAAASMAVLVTTPSIPPILSRPLRLRRR